LLVYETPNNVLDDNIYINRFPEQVVKDTFFTVVSEAHCGDSDETMFLSEKTFKVIACNHPFIIMGNKEYEQEELIIVKSYDISFTIISTIFLCLCFIFIIVLLSND
jgi:hypothetical protein